MLIRSPMRQRRATGARSETYAAWSLLAALLVANAAAWTWAVVMFGARPSLLGVCAIVYGLGLRHAIDADHITAIDNVTRKLLQDGARAGSVGLFFALGHATIVVLVTVLVAFAAGSINLFKHFEAVGGAASTLVSGGFLLALALANLRIFLLIRRTDATDPVGQAAQPGFLTRLIQPLLGLVRRPWQMFPVGFLFGLGFDTATEVAMFGVAGAQASHGFGLGAVLVFPALFTAAMTLIDTADGLVVMQAYRWAFVSPERKKLYNLTITLLSAMAAGAIGTLQLASLAGQVGPRPGWADAAAALRAHLNWVGVGLLAVFLLLWLCAYGLNRLRGRIHVPAE